MQTNCHSDTLVSVEDALQVMLAQVRPVTQTEHVTIDQALDRVLAHDLVSAINLPPFHASAMDGYAVNSHDLEANLHLPVSQRITAGQLSVASLPPGTTARIFTGAPLPAGADTVIPQESCIAESDSIRIMADAFIHPGQFVRLKGSHLNKGRIILTSGTKLGPTEIGMAAAVGIDTLPVYRRLKIAILTTGNELVSPDTELKPGQIYNANHYLLTALAQRLNCDVLPIKPVRDCYDAIIAALSEAAGNCDIIISCGGVSVGDEDHVKTAIEQLGKLVLWKVCIKPGKPLAFGEVLGVPLIGLPGNPVSSFVTFCLFARPFILRSQGMKHTDVRSFPVHADFEQKPDPRREYIRVSLFSNSDGQLVARPYPSQDSATLLSTILSDGLLCIPEGMEIRRGTSLLFMPGTELLG